MIKVYENNYIVNVSRTILLSLCILFSFNIKPLAYASNNDDQKVMELMQRSPHLSYRNEQTMDEPIADSQEKPLTRFKNFIINIETNMYNNINYLSISNTCIHQDEYAVLISWIEKHHGLRSLLLTNCALNDQPYHDDFNRRLVNWLKFNQTLKILDLSHNPLNDKAFDYIAALETNQHLRILKLDETVQRECVDPGAIFCALKANKTLQHLSLKENIIVNIELYVKAISNNVHLQRLDMDNCLFMSNEYQCLINHYIKDNLRMLWFVTQVSSKLEAYVLDEVRKSQLKAMLEQNFESESDTEYQFSIDSDFDSDDSNDPVINYD